MTITRKIYFKSGAFGKSIICKGEPEPLPEIIKKPNRKSEYMMFAVLFDSWLEAGKAKSFEDLALITGLSYVMLSRIMSYRLKSTKEQEELLVAR
jgi:hypothetical protein